eukprot:jgi/Botrbrau1/12558/Bobra.0169s0094.2
MAKHARRDVEDDIVAPLGVPTKRRKRDTESDRKSLTSSISTKRGLEDGALAESASKKSRTLASSISTKRGFEGDASAEISSSKRRKLAFKGGVPGGAGRGYTVSFAVPGSVIDNTQTLEAATLVAGQIARAAAIFNVDEVVVIDDSDAARQGGMGSGAAFLARILQYMETPQYLRRALIAMHPDLRAAGRLPPLDAPHHLRASEWRPYREGVITQSQEGQGSLVDVGLDQAAHIAQAVRKGVRVTLHMGEAPVRRLQQGLGAGEAVLQARLAVPSEPREALGQYWGYSTRIASSLQDVFSKCPFSEGYDVKLGTSERGSIQPALQLGLPSFRHLLVAFGGPSGLEACLPQDAPDEARDPSKYFDKYINTCPGQGSRTIRTEEAILVSLAYLQPAIAAAVLGNP